MKNVWIFYRLKKLTPPKKIFNSEKNTIEEELPNSDRAYQYYPVNCSQNKNNEIFENLKLFM